MQTIHTIDMLDWILEWHVDEQLFEWEIDLILWVDRKQGQVYIRNTSEEG